MHNRDGGHLNLQSAQGHRTHRRHPRADVQRTRDGTRQVRPYDAKLDACRCRCSRLNYRTDESPRPIRTRRSIAFTGRCLRRIMHSASQRPDNGAHRSGPAPKCTFATSHLGDSRDQREGGDPLPIARWSSSDRSFTSPLGALRDRTHGREPALPFSLLKTLLSD